MDMEIGCGEGKDAGREEIAENLKVCTNEHGIHAINVFVDKPFIGKI